MLREVRVLKRKIILRTGVGVALRGPSQARQWNDCATTARKLGQRIALCLLGEMFSFSIATALEMSVQGWPSAVSTFPLQSRTRSFVVSSAQRGRAPACRERLILWRLTPTACGLSLLLLFTKREKSFEWSQ